MPSFSTGTRTNRQLHRQVNSYQFQGMRPHPLLPCGRKRRYPDERTAWTFMLTQQGQTGQALDVYECPTCRGWHMTKRSNQKEE